MISRSFIVGLVFASLCFSLGAAKKPGDPWEKALIQIDVTRRQYDFLQPWMKRTANAQKTGVVISDRQILTTADELSDRTLIRFQKNGRGIWYRGEVDWVDYHANLALLTSKDEQFWNGLQSVEIASKIPPNPSFQILRWRGGNLERKKAEFNQYTVDESQLSFVPQVQLELSSEIQGVGGSEPVIVGKQLVGLNFTRAGNTFRVIPTPFIKPILDAKKKGTYKGLGYFDFVWQTSENPESLKYLKLGGEPRGVIVISSPTNREPLLKPHDVILAVDGYAVDIQGDYLDPEFGHLSLENLATRRKWAGDAVKIKVWRDGREQEVSYILPEARYDLKVVADSKDSEPEYLMVGGLVFQPLNIPFLRTWGADWERRAPFRLSFFRHEVSTQNRPGLIVLSTILPDQYNVGYQDNRFVVVKEVNDKKVNTLMELQESLKFPKNGFHHIEFMQGDSLQRMILSATGMEAATKRVMQTYGIQKAAVIQ